MNKSLRNKLEIISDDWCNSAGSKPRIVRKSRIENWPRNSKTAWELVTAAVEAVKKPK